MLRFLFKFYKCIVRGIPVVPDITLLILYFKSTTDQSLFEKKGWTITCLPGVWEYLFPKLSSFESKMASCPI